MVERLLKEQRGFELPVTASSYATGSGLKQRLKKIEKEGKCDPEE